MKLLDICSHTSQRSSMADEHVASPDQSRHTQELRYLLQAYENNSILACSLLAQDELELALILVNKLHVVQSYEPSMTLFDAIRSINAKLALCNAACRSF